MSNLLFSSQKANKSESDEQLKQDCSRDDSQEKSGKRYAQIPAQIRMAFIKTVLSKQSTIREAAVEAGIKFSTAKAILQTFRKEGRVGKKKFRSRKSKDGLNTVSEFPTPHDLVLYQKLQYDQMQSTGVADPLFEANKKLEYPDSQFLNLVPNPPEQFPTFQNNHKQIQNQSSQPQYQQPVLQQQVQQQIILQNNNQIVQSQFVLVNQQQLFQMQVQMNRNQMELDQQRQLNTQLIDIIRNLQKRQNIDNVYQYSIFLFKVKEEAQQQQLIVEEVQTKINQKGSNERLNE